MGCIGSLSKFTSFYVWGVHKYQKSHGDKFSKLFLLLLFTKLQGISLVFLLVSFDFNTAGGISICNIFPFISKLSPQSVISDAYYAFIWLLQKFLYDEKIDIRQLSIIIL